MSSSSRGRPCGGRPRTSVLACFTRVSKQSAKLDRVVRHGDPVAVNEHLHPDWRHPIECGATILLVAATVSQPVLRMRVDVVGFGGRLESDEEDSSIEI